MSVQNDPIEIAQSLVDSLYVSGDLSVDQADGITAGLGVGADCRQALAVAQAELDCWQTAASDAARVLVAKNDQIAELESQLNEALERNGYLGRLIEILRDAAAPAATALFNIEQLLPDDRTRETIRQTLAPLDAALAAVTARTE